VTATGASGDRRRLNRRVLFITLGWCVACAAPVAWQLSRSHSWLRLGLGLDREVPNRQFLEIAAALGPELTSRDVLALVEKRPMLRYRLTTRDRIGLVSTPPHFGAQHWVAWLEFRSDGRLLAVRYAIRDYLLARPEEHGMPSHRCWGSAEECAEIEKRWPGY
jgi:hypothetical protein